MNYSPIILGTALTSMTNGFCPLNAAMFICLLKQQHYCNTFTRHIGCAI